MTLQASLHQLIEDGDLDLPLPGSGRTSDRHRRLAGYARSDLSMARLAEAHADAISILAEAGCKPRRGLYGVWAAETLGCRLSLGYDSGQLTLNGTKMFCSGAGIVDNALITVGSRLVDVDLRCCWGSLAIDESNWASLAFAETRTAVVHFLEARVTQVVGEDDWYLRRRGFWHGACGPAACWTGGALGLVDYALEMARDQPHTLAHLGALSADAWAMESLLDSAGREIDETATADTEDAKRLALKLRHVIEQTASDVLRRIGRAFGARPLAFDAKISKRIQELELYLRQCHAEQDLELLGRSIFKFRKRTALETSSSYARL